MGGVVGGIILWYKRLYESARDDGTVGFVLFLIMFFLHWAWCVFCAIGECSGGVFSGKLVVGQPMHY
jgi:hypothetical protein